MILRRRPHSALALVLWLQISGVSCATPVGGGPGIPQLPTIFDPASPNALMISNFSWLIHAVMAIVWFGILAALLLFYRRYRARSPEERGRLIFGDTRLELGWTVAPAVIVLAFFALALNVMCTVDAQAQFRQARGDALPVLVLARQWWWEYQLPDQGVITANELHLPVGQPIRMELRSDDVQHNWWVPQLQGKIYNIPGRVNHLGFTPTEVGVFGGSCGEFCGIQHAWMRIRVVVESPEEFQAWVQNQAAPAIPPQSELAQRGAQVFARSTCASCHAINGQVTATANAGPNLTHMASRAILAAGALENTPENMARWLADPQGVKPGNHMPSLRLSPEDLEALTAYMMELR